MITDFASLKAEITAYMARSDLTTVLDSFVQYAEADLTSRLVLTAFEETRAATLLSGANALAVPTDAIETKAVAITTPYQPLTYVEWPINADIIDGLPTWYTVSGANYLFDARPTANLALTLSLRTKLALSGTAPVNKVLLDRPDAYLAACMKQAYLYVKDQANVAFWDTALNRAVVDYNATLTRSKPVTLRTDFPALMINGPYDIRGDR